MSKQIPTRVDWRDFPPVAIHAVESSVKQHRCYVAAKSGDIEAAFELADETIAPRVVNALRATIERADVQWLPVIAEEAAGINRIPLAVAEALSARLGGDITRDVLQINVVGHTGASGWHRLAFPALFRGLVRRGQRYALVDDFVGQGGTLANLRGYVEAEGGRVVVATALTGQSRSAAMRLSLETAIALESKHGSALDRFWRTRFGYGLRFLSESEARYLLHAENVDTIRDRVLAARRSKDPRGPAGH